MLVKARIKSHLDQASRPVYPHVIYEDVIHSLTEQSRLSAAIKVYEQMVAEGLIVSPSLEAQMLAISISQADKQSKNTLVATLKAVVQKEAFKPDDLFEVLGRMSDLDLPSELLLEIMTVFYKSHKSMEGFDLDIRSLQRLAKSAVEHGDAQLTLDALSALPQVDADKIRLSEVYASFIAAIRASVYPDRAVVSAALEQMEKQGIQPSLSVWNSLIAFEVRANSLHRPFAIYNALKGRSGFLPDQNTFGSLFKALNHFYNPKRRRFRYGRRLPDTIPTPRELYREMLGYLARHPRESRFHLTTSLLNTILRSFVFDKDYAGAYLVLRLSYSQHVPVNTKTYFIVFRHLMNRITYGIRATRKMGSVTWADRFLSLPYPISDPSFLRNLQLSNPLAFNLLDISRRQSFELDRPLYISDLPLADLEPVKYRSPTVEEMLGKVAVSLVEEFDSVPLERLMKKALLAEMRSTQEIAQGQATSSLLSETIASVKREMVPLDLRKQLRKMRGELRLLHLIQLARIVAWADVKK